MQGRVIRVSNHIDGFGCAYDRKKVGELMRRSGAEDRKAKAQAKRDRRAAKRAKEFEIEEA